MKKIPLPVLLCLAAILILTACTKTPDIPQETPKTPLTAEEFTRKAEAAGFNIEELAASWEPGTGVINCLRTGKDGYELYFFLFDTLENAIILYEFHKNDLEAQNDDSFEEDFSSGENYEWYMLTHKEQFSYGMYSMYSRIENTMIMVNEYASNKEVLNLFIKDLGYLD
ncbi:MAG: hypothetical protein LBB91_01570 [Clostridiales bacterium]|jgi:hypothetical protein|nr:hypothetical protein [Clostridiales bacterium]